MRAADVLMEHLVPIEFAPSKHTISQGFFLYVFEPGGNRVEITSGGYFVYDPDWEPVMWTEAERARGQAWEVKTVESFHYYGTPPAHADDRAYVARCRDAMAAGEARAR
jgi:catechol 2,3-dioxygenase